MNKYEVTYGNVEGIAVTTVIARNEYVARKICEDHGNIVKRVMLCETAEEISDNAYAFEDGTIVVTNTGKNECIETIELCTGCNKPLKSRIRSMCDACQKQIEDMKQQQQTRHGRNNHPTWCGCWVCKP